MRHFYKTITLILAITAITSSETIAQIDLGVEIMSRYVWRGTDFGNSPSIQPDISLSAGNLTLGTWAAIATNGNPDGSEIDWYLTYDIPTEAGTFSLAVTDYTFPEAPTGNYFDKSAHFIEAGLGYEGPADFPVTLFTGVFLTNDDDNSVYAEIGYTVSNLELFVGFTPAESAMYGTSKAGIINTGIGISREIQVSDNFFLNLLGKIAVNPYTSDTFFMFGFGL
jgi:hypothetical protein